MNGVIVGIQALLLISGVLHLVTQGESLVDDDTAHYCHICANHTMCRFPYDDPGSNCANIENGDLDDKEIELILHWHNSFRNDFASAWRRHGILRSTKDMMQVFWDEELARIARRWVLQCNIHEKDDCRNIDRFPVMQNVNALDLDDVGNHTAFERLEFHMKTWYDHLDFSTADLEYSTATNGGADGLATPTLSKMGCGRATYNVDLHENEHLSRVEALVCNYGPIGNSAVLNMRKDVSGCQLFSTQYSELCIKLQRRETEVEEDEVSFRRRGEVELQRWLHAANVADGAIAAAPFVYLFLVILLLHWSLNRY